MFYAKITAPGALPVEMLVDSAADYEVYYAASFNPLCTVSRFNFDLRGSTYAERKEAAADMAIEWSYISSETALGGLDYAKIENFFERIGRKYGLLREFRENGII